MYRDLFAAEIENKYGTQSGWESNRTWQLKEQPKVQSAAAAAALAASATGKGKNKNQEEVGKGKETTKGKAQERSPAAAAAVAASAAAKEVDKGHKGKGKDREGTKGKGNEFPNKICVYFNQAHGCDRGSACGFRHVEGAPPQPRVPKGSTLCKFFLDGQCKKGDQCEYSHKAIPRIQ